MDPGWISTRTGKTQLEQISYYLDIVNSIIHLTQTISIADSWLNRGSEVMQESEGRTTNDAIKNNILHLIAAEIVCPCYTHDAFAPVVDTHNKT